MKFKINYILICALLLFALSVTAVKAQCDPGDSSSLVEFYYATGGPNWNNNTNWLITPVKDWFGIQLVPPDSNYVGSICMDSNNVVGPLPSVLCNLNHLVTLRITYTSLTGSIPLCLADIPTLSSISFSGAELTNPIPPFGNNGVQFMMLDLHHNSFSGCFPDTILQGPSGLLLNIGENQFNEIHYPQNTMLYNDMELHYNSFTFDDIIPFIENIGLLMFQYTPQDSILSNIDTIVTTGSNLILDSWVDTCSQNRYSWYKNGNWINWLSASSQWVINNIQPGDSGNYTCSVSNYQAPGLFLWRRMVHIHVVDSITSTGPLTSEPERVRFNWYPERSELQLIFNYPLRIKTYAIIYNMHGSKIREIYRGETGQRNITCKLNGLSPGLYVVKVESGRSVLSRKILIL